MDQFHDQPESPTLADTAARRPDRPSKRYTLTSQSDAYRLDRSGNEEPLPEWIRQKVAEVTPAAGEIAPQLLAELSAPLSEPLARADCPGGTIGKSRAALHGLKLAIRGDSSFFAHAYRFTIVLMFGVMIQLPPVAWLILSVCAGQILLAELHNSAIDAFLRCCTPDEQHARAARDIGAAGVFISVTIGTSITAALFIIRMSELLAE
jgi:diacylglycerol kinase (ATP)